MGNPLVIRLGTRASALARWQADWVRSRLAAMNAAVELVYITTSGDRNSSQAIGELGGRGLFTKEIQRALADGTIDLAVHSLKDLPTEAVPGLAVAAVPERASVADLLVCREPTVLTQLRSGAVVGTGSLRRRAQLLHLRPDLEIRDLRGNVDTRLRKLARGDYDAVLLAEAGLDRLGLLQWPAEDPEPGGNGTEGLMRVTLADSAGSGQRIRLFAQRLGPPGWLPAVGQGALGLETRSDDRATRDRVELLDHSPSSVASLAERAMLLALHGGCLAPIAAWARIEAGMLRLTGRVLSVDGVRTLESTRESAAAEHQALGAGVAADLVAQGAAELIAASRQAG